MIDQKRVENCPVCGGLMNKRWSWFWLSVYVCSGRGAPYKHKTKVWVT